MPGKWSRLFSHYPLRSAQMAAYGYRRLRGRAYAEPELTTRQKWKAGFILSGCRQIRGPKGYFEHPVRKLRVIDDVLPLSPFIWEPHQSSELPLPNTAGNSFSAGIPWPSPDASFILRVDDGFVAPDGLVFDAQAIYRNGRWFYHPPPDDLPVKKYDRLLSLVQLWGHRFIHFSFDTLPRIDIAFDFLKANPDVKILVPAANFYKRIIQALEIDPERLVFARPDCVYTAGEMFFPHFYSGGRPHKMGLLPLDAFRRIRRFLVPENGENNNLIIYLQRKSPANRLVEN